MSDLNEQLLAARYLGVHRLPEAGDAGDRRLRAALEREIVGRRKQHFDWARRRIRIGGFAVAPVALLAVVATAAAATTAVITLSATTLFQNDPQGLNFNGDIETVLPSTVRQLATVTIPDFGQVAVWGATTKPGGLCFALKMPDGDWGGLHVSQNTQDGWFGGAIPGCFQTRQQQILKQAPLKPGAQPSGSTGQTLLPTALEEWDNEVKNNNGQQYTIFVGDVEVQGAAATVRDPASGASTPVLTDGYYALAEPTPGGDGSANLQVLNAAGQQLKPDYTWGQMLPGYSAGPSHS